MANTNKKIPEYDHLFSDANRAQDNELLCSSLFHAISHEIRTPLASIVGNSLTLQENWELLTEREKLSSVARIYEEADWLTRIVENLLAVSRMREDITPLHTTEELVEEVIGEALQKLERRHPGCVIHVKVPEDYIFLSMDAILIEQVIINLLENALSRSGSTAPVDMLVMEEPDVISFTVRDYGTSIPEELLFDPLEKAAGLATANSQAGWGIILFTCKAILDAHHGTLKAENHSHGAEFTFTLPKV